MTAPRPPRLLIAKKRDGGVFSAAEVADFVGQVRDGDFSPAQIGALLMAMVTRGMSREETAALTLAMRDSGARLHRGSDGRRRVDKHSTGGVGDKVSLVLAPLAAACGLAVPMISGRGLGHTGGTLDKLEAIPGFQTGLDLAAIERQVAEIGVVIAAQTTDLVPADRILYGIRDVTATVESVALITASILSKKLAEDLDGLVLDVKFGAGAFFPERAAARALAVSLAEVAHAAGCPTVAVLSSMEEPLGRTVGNALEVAEAIRCLRGEGPDDLEALCVALTVAMVRLAEPTLTEAAATERVQTALASGAAREKMEALIAAQGGDPAVVSALDRLPAAPLQTPIRWEGSDGWVTRVDARKVAEAAALLGAGRRREGDAIDFAVGFADLCKVGEGMRAGDLLGTVHARAADTAGTASALLREAVTVGPEAPPREPLIAEIIFSHAL